MTNTILNPIQTRYSLTTTVCYYDYMRIKKAAKNAGMTVSDFLRKKLDCPTTQELNE